MIRLSIFFLIPLIVIVWMFRSLGQVFGAMNVVSAYDYSAEPASRELSFDFFPTKAGTISQGYGRTAFAVSNIAKKWHNGIDISATRGTEIHSASEGAVIFTGNQDEYCYGGGYGKFAVVQDTHDEYTLLYAHLNTVDVKKGIEIKKGDAIGRVGMTGFATGPHLHFSVFKTNSFKMENKKNCGPTPEGVDINPFVYLH